MGGFSACWWFRAWPQLARGPARPSGAGADPCPLQAAQDGALPPDGDTTGATDAAPCSQPRCAIKGQTGSGRVRHNSQAGYPCGYPRSQSSPTSANPPPFSPLAPSQAHECRVRHSPRDGSWENPLPGNASWSTWGEGKEAPPAAYTPRGTILHAGFLGAVGGSDGNTAPACLREMKEQLRGAGTAPCLQPKACGRPAASAAAGTNACTYLCPGTGVCSSLPRL